MILADLLKEKRRDLGLTREEMADRIGMPVQEIVRWEVDGYLPRTLDIFDALLNAYEIDRDNLQPVLVETFWERRTNDQWEEFLSITNENNFRGFIEEDIVNWAKEGSHNFVLAMCKMVLDYLDTAEYEQSLNVFRAVLFNDNPKFYLKHKKDYNSRLHSFYITKILEI